MPGVYFRALVLIDGDLFKIVGLEDLVAGQTADIVDAIAPHQEFRFLMLANRHKFGITPF